MSESRQRSLATWRRRDLPTAEEERRMYARLTTIQLQPGMTERLEGMFNESVLPASRQQTGFRGGLVLADGGTGKAVLVSLWESEEDLRAGEASGYYQEQVAKLAGVGLFAGPPVRETFEVKVQV
jgi:heme-degrading monooxygenase HmoA